MSAIGLIKSGGHDSMQCPICESQLTVPTPTVAQIERSLNELNEQLEAVEAENPRLQLRLSALLREEAAIEERRRCAVGPQIIRHHSLGNDGVFL
jgi:hypothetical protein